MPKTPTDTKFKGKTHILCVLDRSGSMYPLVSDTIGGYNGWLKTTKKAFRGLDVAYTLHLFDDRHETPQVAAELADVPNLDRSTQLARGSTALLDAIGFAVGDLKQQMAKQDRALVLIVTDGHENASREYTQKQIKKLLGGLDKADNWTIDYLGANQDAFTVGQGLGMHVNTGTTTAATSAGTAAMWSTNSGRTMSLAGSGEIKLAARSQSDYDAALAAEQKKEAEESK